MPALSARNIGRVPRVAVIRPILPQRARCNQRTGVERQPYRSTATNSPSPTGSNVGTNRSSA